MRAQSNSLREPCGVRCSALWSALLCRSAYPAHSTVPSQRAPRPECPLKGYLSGITPQRAAVFRSHTQGSFILTMDDLDDEMYGNKYVNVGPYNK